MLKKQNHTLTYTLVYKQFGVIKETKIEGRLLDYILNQFCKQCINEDNTGIFFELENADVDYYESIPTFHKVTVDGIDYGIILEDLKIESPLRNEYLCELRAKRELLGYHLEDFANECCLNLGDYKEKEEGHRPMKLNEYAMCMKILKLHLNK